MASKGTSLPEQVFDLHQVAMQQEKLMAELAEAQSQAQEDGPNGIATPFDKERARLYEDVKMQQDRLRQRPARAQGARAERTLTRAPPPAAQRTLKKTSDGGYVPKEGTRQAEVYHRLLRTEAEMAAELRPGWRTQDLPDDWTWHDVKVQIAAKHKIDERTMYWQASFSEDVASGHELQHMSVIRSCAVFAEEFRGDREVIRLAARKACYADPAMNTPTKPLDGYRAQGVALWKASEEWIGTSHGGLQTSKIWFIFASKGYLKLQDLVT
eukprot:g29474.t1